MKSVNILAVEKIFKINVNPLNDRLKGTTLEYYTKDVYYSYEDIEINEAKKIPEENAWLINGKYKVTAEPKRSDITETYFADEKEVIATVIALNETEYNKHQARLEEEKAITGFLLEAMEADGNAAKRLK